MSGRPIIPSWLRQQYYSRLSFNHKHKYHDDPEVARYQPRTNSGCCIESDEVLSLHHLVKSEASSTYQSQTFKKKRHVVALSCGLWFFTNVCYFSSLRGADTPKGMNHLLGLLGAFLVTAVAAFSLQFWLAYLSSHVSIWTSLISQLLTLLVWPFLDHGNSLREHGAYNLLIFFLILVPSNLLIAFVTLWYHLAAGPADARRPQKFWYQLGVGGVIACLAITSLAWVKENRLGIGFFGLDMPQASYSDTYDAGMCQWQHGVPWFDFIPFRLNFFTGPMTCPQDKSFSALFDHDGHLVITCDAPQTIVPSYFNDTTLMIYEGPTYSLLPRTSDWGYELKQDGLQSIHNGLQLHVLEYIEDHISGYDGPVALSNDIDTVLARCGSQEPKLVTRIAAPSPSFKTTRKLTHPRDDGLNVVTIFIDAVSRPQFHRRLPQTRATLEGLASSPNSKSSLFQFWRYHVVGMNTQPNTRALWAGLNTDESLPPTEQPIGPPLWEQFEAAGYTSARIDPMCQDWTAYYDSAHAISQSNGTTLSSSARRISYEHLAWSCLPPYLPVGPHFAGNFAGATSIKARCISDTHVGWHELDWASDFISTLQPLPCSSYPDSNNNNNSSNSRATSARAYYLNAAFMEGHEGSGAVLSTLDARLSAFLDPTTSPINFDSTAVLIVSDHGALMGLNYAFLRNGKVEAANPFAALVLPDRYLEGGGDRRRNLERAQDRLITGFDLYETVRGFMGARESADVAGSGEHEDESRRSGNEGVYYEGLGTETSRSGKRGFDLVRQRLPDRDCEAAGIPAEMCRCR